MFPNPHLVINPRGPDPHLVIGPRDPGHETNQRKRRKRGGDRDLVARNEEGRDLVTESQVGPDHENEDVDLYRGNAEGRDLANERRVDHDLEKGDNRNLVKNH